jgi:2-polyprenyl-3-methyl-5-hydroxy-6-metoxy-1,4-benzoquinol methylase
MTATELDMKKLEEFGGRMSGFLNGGAAALMLSIGHQAGLFDTMAGMTHATSQEIAEAAGLDERYVREWLGAMVTAGVVEYDSGRGAYTLPPEHAAFTTRAAGANNFAAFMQLVPLIGAVEQEVLDKFHNGGGVPYSSYGRFQQVMSDTSGAIFDANLVTATLPLVPGIVDRLESGIEVADIATGSGHAINVMAKAFPKSNFVGFDFSEEGIARGRAEAAEWGLTNATFEAKDVSTLDAARQFDFITTFDAVHDQAKPRIVVQVIYDALKPGGYWLCVDVQASSHVGENIDHPMGTFGYTVSCMHCMTVSLAYDGEGLGAMWGVHQARELFADAGFVNIQVHTVDGDPFNNYYVCQKSK